MACHFEIMEFSNCGRTCYLPSYFSIKIGVPSEQSWRAKVERLFMFSLLLPNSTNGFSDGQLLTKRFIDNKKYITDYQWYEYLWKLYRMYGRKNAFLSGPAFTWINPGSGTFTVNLFDNGVRASAIGKRKITITSPGILEGWVVPMVIDWLKEYPDPRYHLSERMHMARLLDSLYEDD